MTLADLAKKARVRTCDIRYLRTGDDRHHLQVSLNNDWNSFHVWEGDVTLEQTLDAMSGLWNLDYLLINDDLDRARK